jgi:hypothetical protein
MKRRFAFTLILSISCAYVFCQDSTEKKGIYTTIQMDSIAKSLVLYSVLEPGKHTFLSTSENQATLSVTLEGDKIYYIRQEVKMGVFFAETALKLEDEQKGQKDLRKCKLARDNVYTN